MNCQFPECDCDRIAKCVLGPDTKFDNTKVVTSDYDVLDEDHPNTCRCEVCRFWGA